jgi:hypothetical protein
MDTGGMLVAADLDPQPARYQVVDPRGRRYTGVIAGGQSPVQVGGAILGVVVALCLDVV